MQKKKKKFFNFQIFSKFFLILLTIRPQNWKWCNQGKNGPELAPRAHLVLGIKWNLVFHYLPFIHLKSIWISCIFQRYLSNRSLCQLTSLFVPKQRKPSHLPDCFWFNQSINLFHMYSYYLTNQSIKCFIYPL